MTTPRPRRPKWCTRLSVALRSCIPCASRAAARSSRSFRAITTMRSASASAFASTSTTSWRSSPNLLRRLLREVVSHREVERELPAPQERWHRHRCGGALEHLDRLLIQHVVARSLRYAERGNPAARAEGHPQGDQALPVVIARDSRIALVLGRRADQLQ